MRARRARVVAAILVKDFSEAVRDARVVIPLLIPLGLGVAYSFAFGSGVPLPKATVVYVAGSPTRLPAEVARLAAHVVQLHQRRATSAATARAQVAAGDATLGVVVPAGFDAGLHAGRRPRLVLLLPRPPSNETAVLETVVQRAAGVVSRQPPPFKLRAVPVAVTGSSTIAAIDRLGVRLYEVLLVTVLLLVMIGVSITPTILSDEVQTRTLDALLLVASYVEVILAKAAFGIITSLAGVPVLLLLARARPAETATFALIMVLSALVLVGLGLLLGSYMRTQGQLSVWSNLAFFPLIGAVILATVDLPAPWNALITILPTVPMTRLAGNAMAGLPVFPYAALSWVSLVVWVGMSYGALAWRMSRIEA